MRDTKKNKYFNIIELNKKLNYYIKIGLKTY